MYWSGVPTDMGLGVDSLVGRCLVGIILVWVVNRIPFLPSNYKVEVITQQYIWQIWGIDLPSRFAKYTYTVPSSSWEPTRLSRKHRSTQFIMSIRITKLRYKSRLYWDLDPCKNKIYAPDLHIWVKTENLKASEGIILFYLILIQLLSCWSIIENAYAKVNP